MEVETEPAQTIVEVGGQGRGEGEEARQVPRARYEGGCHNAQRHPLLPVHSEHHGDPSLLFCLFGRNYYFVLREYGND